MKLLQTSLALTTGNAGAALKAPLPEFKNEKQLAEWRAEKASQPNTRTATAEPAFYTGKPYLASSGSYVFKYRSYSPEMARWTSKDASGFPDGANNQLYVNNMILNCIDRVGLNIWHLTNRNAVSGAGHAAMLSGSGNNFQLQSYGSGRSGSASSSPSSSNGLTIEHYNSLQAALSANASQGYTNYTSWDTTIDQDLAARGGFSAYATNAPYSLASHNCADAVSAGLNAAGVSHDETTNVPRQLDSLNQVQANSFGKLTE